MTRLPIWTTVKRIGLPVKRNWSNAAENSAPGSNWTTPSETISNNDGPPKATRIAKSTRLAAVAAITPTDRPSSVDSAVRRTGNVDIPLFLQAQFDYRIRHRFDSRNTDANGSTWPIRSVCLEAQSFHGVVTLTTDRIEKSAFLELPALATNLAFHTARVFALDFVRSKQHHRTICRCFDRHCIRTCIGGCEP